MPKGKKVVKKVVEKVVEKIIDYSPTTVQNNFVREQLVSLLKVKIPKLFDRDPQSYSNERLNSLVDEIIKLK